MLVSLKWLKDYVDIDLSPQELADRLTMAGLEVDEIITREPAFSGVVVAKILSVVPHPQADRLSLCDVSDGDAVYPVVCGATNIQAGDMVPMAKVGAVLPGGHTIQSTRLRGCLSEGMLCSAVELAIGDDATGILQLNKDLKPGEPLQTALDLSDTVFDISVTPNRSDCLSMLGIAREVAALTGKKIKVPRITFKETKTDIHTLSSVAIEDADLCPRYTARLIQNVEVGPSPVWLKARLEAAGLRSINNVVDVTNFVMLETGQPLHAFDYRFLEEGRIVVRRSREGERFTSLDEKERVLSLDTLLICDGRKPVAIGGIMGGLNSEVQDDTSTILLESAYFLPESIRRSARRLSMSTDAAYRFERGIDPDGVVPSLNRAAQLMAKLASGSVCQGVIDVFPGTIAIHRNIPLRLQRVHDILGMKITASEATKILRSLGMMVDRTGKGEYAVTPPASRVDIAREIDLIEEIVRLYGYDRVPSTLPSASASELPASSRVTLETRIRSLMIGMGYTEIINYSFTTPGHVESLRLDINDIRRNTVGIKNPITEDQSVMRSTLVYGLLDTMRRNANNGSHQLKIFESGRTFVAHPGTELPREDNMMACLITGARTESFWDAKTPVDFYDLKACLDNLFFDLKLSADYRSGVAEPYLHPGQSGSVYLGDQCVGFIGAVHPEVQKRMDLRNKAYVFEINMDIVYGVRRGPITCSEVSKFPSVTRDVAFVVPNELEARKLIDVVFAQGEDLLENVEIFDIYAGKGLAEGTKSLGLRFSYRSAERTLTDTEVNSAHEYMIKRTIELTGATIRY